MKMLKFLGLVGFLFLGSGKALASSGPLWILCDAKTKYAMSIVVEDGLLKSGPYGSSEEEMNQSAILTTDGDCAKRDGFSCYQNGRLVVNIPKELTSGARLRGRIYINIDVDDLPGLGSPSNCQIQKN